MGVRTDDEAMTLLELEASSREGAPPSMTSEGRGGSGLGGEDEGRARARGRGGRKGELVSLTTVMTSS